MFSKELSVSADQSPFAIPKLMRWVYKDFTGVEVIGWLWSQGLVNISRREKYDVISLHGPTGDFDGKKSLRDHFKNFITKRLMLDTHDAIFLAGMMKIPRILVHLPEARENLHALRYTFVPVAIENDITLLNGVEETARFVRDLAKKRGNRSTEMVLDIGHFALSRSLIEEPDKAVEEALRLIEVITRDYGIKISLHIPLDCGGDNGSLDFTKVSLSNIRRILEFKYVIENQIDRPLAWINPFYLRGYIKRTREVMNWFWEAFHTNSI